MIEEGHVTSLTSSAPWYFDLIKLLGPWGAHLYHMIKVARIVSTQKTNRAGMCFFIARHIEVETPQLKDVSDSEVFVILWKRPVGALDWSNLIVVKALLAPYFIIKISNSRQRFNFYHLK